METQSPKRRNQRFPKQPMELLYNILWISSTNNKSKINNTSNRPEYFKIATITKTLNFNIQRIWCSKISHIMITWSFSG